MAKLWKIRDKVTNKFWNGDYRRSSFSEKGKTWNKQDKAEGAVAVFIRYRNRFPNTTSSHSLPNDWEIVEIELIEQKKDTCSLTEFLQYQLLRSEVEKIDSTLVWFMDSMRNKKVLDKIEFMFKLKPAEGQYYVDRERIKEARAHMRQLGVKTRTFREGNGIFGMLDRQQALRARLTLDVDRVVDLGEIRKRMSI